MKLKIEVKSSEVAEKTVKRKGDGREFFIRNQTGWIDLGKPYPQEVQISLDENQAAYPVGQYVMDPTCLYVGRYNTLSLGKLRLIAAK